MKSGKIKINIVNLRDFTNDKHKKARPTEWSFGRVDDKPYGGGAGMVLRVDVVEKAIDAAKCKNKCKEKIILLDPQGKQLNQQIVRKLSKIDNV